MALRVGLNALFLIPGKVGGTETYVRQLLRELARQEQQMEFVLFVNRSAAGQYCPSQANFREVVCPVAGEGRLARVFWEQVMLPRQCREYGLHLMHSLGSTGPVSLPVPSLLTLHDTQYLHYPDNFGWLRRNYLRWVTPRAARAARWVIAISQSARQDITDTLGISDPGHVVVIYHGADHLAPAEDTPPDAAEGCPVLEQRDIRLPYVLSLAMSFPHKNLDRLVKAFRRLLTHPEAAGLSLVLVGQAGPGQQALLQAIEEQDMAQHVRLTGYLPGDEIPHLLRHSTFFVFPSLFEGFGLPVLEAMNQGVPVTCSDRTSLPEIVGDGALLFDPLSEADMEAAMLRYVRAPELRRQMVVKGRQRVPQFRWADTAAQVLVLYRKIESSSST